jgi:hypothetical protein
MGSNGELFSIASLLRSPSSPLREIRRGCRCYRNTLARTQSASADGKVSAAHHHLLYRLTGGFFRFPAIAGPTEPPDASPVTQRARRYVVRMSG